MNAGSAFPTSVLCHKGRTSSIIFAYIENLPATNANVLNVCCMVICVIGEILKCVYWDMVIEQNKIAIIPEKIEKWSRIQ